MKYLGSKNRISKEILPIILKDRNCEQYYIEPFVGGANMIDKVNGFRIGADSNKYIIALLNKMKDINFEAPDVDEVLYYNIKDNKDLYDDWIVGYAGTQLSFGSTWFGSYRRDSDGERNYSIEASRNVNKQSKNIKDIEFINTSYEKLHIPKNSIIYCDPPYNTNATKGKYKDDFNHDKFWQWCRDMSSIGHKVFVSEYNAPSDFKCIWSKEINQRMNNLKSTSKGVEKLFIYDAQSTTNS